MKVEVKIVCPRCKKVLAVLEGPEIYSIPPVGHQIEIGPYKLQVCEECYKEYKKLKKELDEYVEKRLSEWLEEKNKNGK